MIRSRLKSGSALVLAVAVGIPAPLAAQATAFPCVAPSGDTVPDAPAYAAALATFAGSASPVAPELSCTQEALDQALAIGGEDLRAALDPVLPAIVAAAPLPEIAEPQAPVAEAAPAAPEPVVEQVESSDAVPAEPVPQETTGAEAEAPSAVPQVSSQTDRAVALPLVAPTSDAGVEQEAATEAALIESTAEAQDTQSVAPAEPVPVGEAGAAALSDAERQDLAQSAEAPSAAAAAAASSATEAEVTTQVVTEADTRSSTQDFATSVASGAAPAPAATPKDEGLSKFQQALLLGLGAAVVGTVLNNGDQVLSNTGDRVVVERNGELKVLKNDDEILQRPGAELQTSTYQDGSTRTVVTYDDGSQIVTVRSNDGTVLRRTMIRALDGSEVVLFDDTQAARAIDFEALPTSQALQLQQERLAAAEDVALAAALRSALLADVGRTFSLQQVREYKRVRALAPQVEIEAITFASGSAAIEPEQVYALSELGQAMREVITDDPSAVFLVEGHTDAVGASIYNLALSDRRAETVALALAEYFEVPPQNIITQGYGESDLKRPVLTDERINRRAVVRNITALLR